MYIIKLLFIVFVIRKGGNYSFYLYIVKFFELRYIFKKEGMKGSKERI